MRYKYLIDDFVVSEHLREGILLPDGPFAVFLLEKYNQDTFQVLEKLQRFWKISSRDIGIAGIKDKQAHTFQYISVPRRIHRLPDQRGFRLSHKGYTRSPLSGESLLANEFLLTIREIANQEKPIVEDRLEHLARQGMPNYFDNQRFGSYIDGEWLGKLLFLGDLEKLLRLWIKTHAPQSLRRSLDDAWGNWAVCLEICQNAHWATGIRLFGFLSQPGHDRGFRHAVGLLDHRFLVFIANAYLSFLFNQSLSRRLQQSQGIFLSTRAGDVFFPTERGNLPQEGWVVAYDAPEVDPFTEEVLRQEHLHLHDLKIRGIYGVTIHAKKRPLWIYPEILEHTWEEDEIFAGYQKLRIRLRLPPASYATWVLKFLTAFPTA